MVALRKTSQSTNTYKKRVQHERRMQRDFFIYLKIKFPDIRALSFAVPNGGKRNPREAKYLKESGVTAGIPDVFICKQSDKYPLLIIEFKYGDGKLTPIQREKIALLRAEGYDCAVCYSWIEAWNYLMNYLGGDYLNAKL